MDEISLAAGSDTNFDDEGQDEEPKGEDIVARKVTRFVRVMNLLVVLVLFALNIITVNHI